VLLSAKRLELPKQKPNRFSFQRLGQYGTIVLCSMRKIAETRKENTMPRVIASPSVIKACGNKPKIIEEFVGRVNSQTEAVSIARMKSPSGWEEPAQTPEFDEYTVVVRGTLRVESKDGQVDVNAGQAIIVSAGERVRYSTPSPEGAEYIAVCIPAFSPETVHRS
jgi:mannose-6-phosphate isomerase-like protein (cupin superfamily)